MVVALHIIFPDADGNFIIVHVLLIRCTHYYDSNATESHSAFFLPILPTF
jgi:hypothetical protein